MLTNVVNIILHEQILRLKLYVAVEQALLTKSNNNIKYLDNLIGGCET